SMRQQRAVTPEQAYERLADACSRAEYCTHELRQKLLRMGVGADDAARVLGRLSRERYVDDGRYARAFVRLKAGYGRWGRRKIAYALAMKRIDRRIVSEAMDEIDPEAYAEALKGLLKAKLRSGGQELLTSYEGRTRLFRYAAGRGYEADAIAAAIKTLMA
ncbi:MAG: RecX family transcriptional regulator, partial [Muribaculaceae bacterium]|nr:RecX family transcriptional regulator [Muribaculaceae bacterium]